MAVGLPGIAIGGLFFVICALAMPFVELGRAAAGRSSRARWRLVARQTTMAVAILLSVERVVWLGFLARAAATTPGGGDAATETAKVASFAFPVVPVLVTAGSLALVLLGAYVMLLVRGRATEEEQELGAEARRAA